MKLFSSILTATILMANLGTAEAISTLDTEAGSISNSNLVYGQTFSLSDAGTFDAWTFRADDGGDITNYSVFLYGWDGVASTVAPLLYGNTGVTSGIGGIQTITGLANGALLNAGEYALFLLETGGQFSQFATRDDLAPDYTGGSLIVQNDIGFNPTGTWGVFENVDLSFSVEIGPTPIPLPSSASLILIGIGLLGSLGAIRRKS